MFKCFFSLLTEESSECWDRPWHIGWDAWGGGERPVCSSTYMAALMEQVQEHTALDLTSTTQQLLDLQRLGGREMGWLRLSVSHPHLLAFNKSLRSISCTARTDEMTEL